MAPIKPSIMIFIRPLTFVVFFFSSLTSMSLNAQPIKYIDNTDSVDKHGAYFISVLKLALEKSKVKYGDYAIEGVPVAMRQERQFKSIESGLIDLMWTVTSTRREENALAIRIPLLKGLIGHRVLVINKTKEASFANIKSLAQLAELSAIQGHDWPDVYVLENAGLKVEKTISHSSMYKLVAGNIVDYFPRSLLEVIEEMESNGDDSLIIDPHHLLVYPSAIYFFVTKQNKQLAERIEFGLKAALADGSFDTHFYAYPGHSKALQQIPVDNRIIFRLENPIMSNSTPIQDNSLWLNLN
ncbi:hypothetical protein [Alteromonas sp. M12]|uniref:hypothetical protein n=1 Tax=Alteromonas sp. M12 TaxID=3135644 RepID=UPI00319E7F92